jgi:hypothetical protein
VPDVAVVVFDWLQGDAEVSTLDGLVIRIQLA